MPDEGIDMTEIQPIDSAFTGGEMKLLRFSGSVQADSTAGIPENTASLTETLPVTILIIIFTIIFIANLRAFINMVPSFTGCLFRWKENVNLENSVSLRLTRNRIFYIMTIPFCILAASYRLYCPDILSDLPPLYYLLAVTGTAAAYLILRNILNLIFKSRRMNEKTFKAAVHSFRTFFIITVTVTLATSGIMRLAAAGDGITGRVLLYETALFYLVYMIRKTQIFANSCSLFVSILYLCALEILPTGILVATAIVL